MNIYDRKKIKTKYFLEICPDKEQPKDGPYKIYDIDGNLLYYTKTEKDTEMFDKDGNQICSIHRDFRIPIKRRRPGGHHIILHEIGQPNKQKYTINYCDQTIIMKTNGLEEFKLNKCKWKIKRKFWKGEFIEFCDFTIAKIWNKCERTWGIEYINNEDTELLAVILMVYGLYRNRNAKKPTKVENIQYIDPII